MNKQKNSNGTYLTSFVSETKRAEEKKILTSPKKSSSSRRRINNYKSNESSALMPKKKLPSIKFPFIKENNRKNKKMISNLFDSSDNSLNKIQKKNLLNNSHKNNKKIIAMISKLKKGNSPKNKRNYFLQIKFNSNSIDKSIKKNKFKTIQISPIKREKNKKSLNHNVKSAKNLKTLFINNIEFNKKNKIEKRNNISPKNSLNYLVNSFSSKSQIIKSSSSNKKKFKSILDEFRQKEKLLEQSKRQLYEYSLKRYSPRLLRKKGKNEITKKDIYSFRNNNDEKYKIKTMIFKNRIIPYADRINIGKNISKLPPLKLGSRYIIPKKSLEVLKREEFNEAINKIIKENNKSRKKKKLNLTKKEILNRVRNRNLKFCNNRIRQTEEDVNIKKNKIIENYNTLKLSLNQFDNWNSLENVDNLFTLSKKKYLI